MFFSGIFVLISTLSRRYILSFLIIIYIYYILLSFNQIKKYFIYRIIGVPAIALLLYTSYVYFNDFFQGRSVIYRFDHWVNNINTIANSKFHFLYGFGYLQMVIKKVAIFSFVGQFPIEIMDNMYLSWLMFGGIFFSIVMLLYLGLTIFISLRCFFSSHDNTVKEFSLIIVLNTLFILIAGMFGTFWDNIQESFLFWYIQPVMMSYIISNSRTRQR